jgi:hypothetical protein
MILPVPSIQVYPVQRMRDVYVAAGSLRFGKSEPILISARVSTRFVQNVVDALTRATEPASPAPAAAPAPPADSPPAAVMGTHTAGEAMLVLQAGWTPQYVAKWYGGDMAEMLTLNDLGLDSQGRPHPWRAGQHVRLPASWNAAHRPPPPAPVRVGKSVAKTTEDVALNLAASGAVKTALDVAQFVPVVGEAVWVARGTSGLVRGIMQGHPQARRQHQIIRAAAKTGDPHAQALLLKINDASKAHTVLTQAESGDPAAMRTLLQVQDDARQGDPQAVDAAYAIEGMRDAMTPDFRDEESDTEVSGSRVGCSMVGADRVQQAAHYLRQHHIGLTGPSQESDDWLRRRLDAVLSGVVGCSQ